MQSSSPVVTETRQYNALGQLTNITAVQGSTTITNLSYVFPTGTNNGRISSMVNAQSGETVSYQYDELNRLKDATSGGMPGIPNSSWYEDYQFDGFGNLSKKGAQSIGVLAASNRLTGTGISYDSNGNQTGMQVGTTNVTNTFDIENRLLEVSGQGFRYGFGPDNRKMWTKNASNGDEDYVFWGPQGKPIGTYRAAWEWTQSSGTLWFNAVVTTRRWMGSKEISASSVLIHDRLSSVVGVSAGGSVTRHRYLPYGEPNTAGGSPAGSHFASYDRTDAGMYYADQRYYRDGVGRFLTADPYQASGGPGDPLSWNRYAYTRGDPANRSDPSGLADEMNYDDYYGTRWMMLVPLAQSALEAFRDIDKENQYHESTEAKRWYVATQTTLTQRVRLANALANLSDSCKKALKDTPAPGGGNLLDKMAYMSTSVGVFDVDTDAGDIPLVQISAFFGASDSTNGGATARMWRDRVVGNNAEGFVIPVLRPDSQYIPNAMFLNA